LSKLPVQLLDHDGQSQVIFFENLIAAQHNHPGGYLPHGTGALVDDANLDGSYTLASVSLPMGTRVVRSVDLQGLPQRHFHTMAGVVAPVVPVNHVQATPQPSPPMPMQGTPNQQAPTVPLPAQAIPGQQADFLLYSEVRVRHVGGEPLVGYYLEKAAAQRMGTPNGMLPSDSTALLLKLDAPNRDGGHCKIRWKQNGCQLDAYIDRAHICSHS
jgi:hypothetical protein